MGTHGNGRKGVVAACGVALMSVGAGCVLLVVNGAFVAALYAALQHSGMPLVGSQVTAQFLFFVGPVALLAAQWWTMDFLSGRARRRHARILR